ncbi:hypothetical protein ACXWR7_12925, partial [Streptococcus pyogenes]
PLPFSPLLFLLLLPPLLFSSFLSFPFPLSPPLPSLRPLSPLFLLFFLFFLSLSPLPLLLSFSLLLLLPLFLPSLSFFF